MKNRGKRPLREPLFLYPKSTVTSPHYNKAPIQTHLPGTPVSEASLELHWSYTNVWAETLSCSYPLRNGVLFYFSAV